ncbi:minichromosome maintenance- protein [Borealophlyctis nickersoniae]|nr:minichromosome maintenance- protein [Borealophlyctis nickersoniae]
MHNDDIPGDWVTIGVMADKSSPRTAKNGNKYCLFKFSDLAGSIVNVFAFDDSFDRHWKELVGSVIAVLNPKILLPTEAGHSVGLSIDHPDKWMKIGTSVDLGFCKGVRKDGEKCTVVINTQYADRCDRHNLRVHKMARIERQELASGDAMLSIGDPRKALKSKPKKKFDAGSGTYVFGGGQTIYTDGIKTVQNLAPCSGDHKFSAAEERQLKDLISSDTHAARMLRAARGMPDLPSGPPKSSVFGPGALSRMGFDPITGSTFVPAVKKTETGVPAVKKKPTEEFIELELVE